MFYDIKSFPTHSKNTLWGPIRAPRHPNKLKKPSARLRFEGFFITQKSNKFVSTPTFRSFLRPRAVLTIAAAAELMNLFVNPKHSAGGQWIILTNEIQLT